MSVAPTFIAFGEWMPDQPEFGQGYLTEAVNIIPYSDYYVPFQPLTTAYFSTLPAASRGAFLPHDSSGFLLYAAAADNKIYMTDASGTLVARSATLPAPGTFDWEFAQFENLVLAANINNAVYYHTKRAATNITSITCPHASTIGLIGKFLFLGNITDDAVSGTTFPARVRWSSIEDPLDFPTPNSATAIARQAGQQDMDSNLGAVRKIIPGDQFGLIIQERGITRVTYVGGSVVFQFDQIDNAHGIFYQSEAIKVENLTYFKSRDGLYKTDGVSVMQIGVGKVDKTFLTDSNSSIPQAGYDRSKRCVFWAYGPTGSPSVYSRILYHNIDNGRFSLAHQTTAGIANGNSSFVEDAIAFSGANVISSFSGAGATAWATTSEQELNPGGYSLVDGVKPMINYASPGATGKASVALGTRDDQADAVVYTSESTAMARTGFADFRSEARYHRARVTILNLFTKAFGLEPRFTPTSEV
jgi:hypothetical protein